MTRPPSSRLGGEGSSRMIDIAVTLLPQPDSPTSPTVRPAGTVNDTSSTTRTRPLSIAKETERSSTERREVAVMQATGGRKGPPHYRFPLGGRPRVVAPAGSLEHHAREVER